MPTTTTQTDHRLGIEVEQRGRVLLARLHGGPRGEFGPEIAADLDSARHPRRDRRRRRRGRDHGHPPRALRRARQPALAAGGRRREPERRTARQPRRSCRRRAPRAPSPACASSPTARRSAARWSSPTCTETFLRMNRCGAVFIAALNGSALGIGSELALACDYRLMADGDHVIGQPEILLGFPPGGGGTQRLVRLVGTHQGLKRMLDGGGLDPEDAAEIGYVDEVVAGRRADRPRRRARRPARAATEAHRRRGQAQRLHRRLARPRGRPARRERRVPLHARQPRRAGRRCSPTCGAPRRRATCRCTTDPPTSRRSKPAASDASREPEHDTDDPHPSQHRRPTHARSTSAARRSPTASSARRGGVPLVFLHHFTAVLDDWDPRVIDGIAAKRHVITFDNRGVGATGGSVPHTIDEMAADAVAFIRALGHEQVDLLGFSLGGGVAQVIALDASRARPAGDPRRHRPARRRRDREDAA